MNPMEQKYDLAVIGGGSAGLSAARFARKLGLSVLIAESGRLGGDCTWSGCVPSKALLNIARMAHEMRTGSVYGLPSLDGPLDLSRVLSIVRAAREEVYNQESPEALCDEGIDVLPGDAVFESPYQLQVGTTPITAKRFLITTGARPFVPPIPGLEEVPYFTYETIWDMPALPRRLLVVGGGPIGCELAQAFRRLGADVTLIGRAPRLLPRDEPEASEALRVRLLVEGVDLHLNTGLERVERADEEIIVTAGKARVQGDGLLLALGRRPNVATLGLDAAGVTASARGIHVNARLRTTQAHIYAAGDCTGGHQFTHYAGWQGVMAVRNAFLPGATKGVLEHVPWTTFTDPEIAHAGMTEAVARERVGQKVSSVSWPLSRVDRAITDGKAQGFVRVVLDPRRRVIGATVVAPHAGEMIHEWVIAIDQKLRLSDIASSIHVYPTYGFGNWQLAGAARMDSLVQGMDGSILRWLAGRA